MKLTAAVIARDEQDTIADCLRSLEFADERLVLIDAATRDATREVARALGARVAERAFDNFAAQREAALALAHGDWVLFVDADERVTPALRDEVVSRIGRISDGRRGYWIPRHNYIMGRLVRRAGWYPDYQLRLLERRSARFDPLRVVHELAIVDGPLGYLCEPLVHINYRTLGEFVRKQERYCRLDARRWLASYGRPRARSVLGQPAREFWRRYVELRGIDEGWLGLLLSLLLAYYAGKSVWLARRGGSGDRPPQVGHAGQCSDLEHELGQ